MNRWHDRSRRQDLLASPVVWLAFLLSLAVHVGVLWEWLPRLPAMASDTKVARDGSPLAVQLTDRARAPAAAASAPLPSTPSPALRDAQQVAAAMRMPRPAPSAPAPIIAPPVAAPNPAPAFAEPAPSVASPLSPAPLGGDLASYVEARRRARGEPESAPAAAGAPVANAESAQRDRAAAANLAGLSASPLGAPPRNGGGLFRIKRMGYHDAEFIFFGWNKEIERRIPQMIEVRQGGHEDIQLAVIRKIIAIIREHEPADFGWESNRLGRLVVLSARARDNAELERFMLREFFDATRAPR